MGFEKASHSDLTFKVHFEPEVRGAIPCRVFLSRSGGVPILAQPIHIKQSEKLERRFWRTALAQ